MLGLYVHIPFCHRKCRYCDFPSYGGVENRYLSAYVNSLCREIAVSDWPGEAVDTIYFGGGTPSLLKPEQVNRILTALRQRFQVTADAEITLEANPDSIDQADAERLAHIGINRISLGVQSFHDDRLQALGRLHTSLEGKQAVQAVYAGGIHNISVDLMYGLPGQTVQEVREDLIELTSLPIHHASVYSLIVEEHTLLWNDLHQGRLALPDEEIVDAMAEVVHANLPLKGFERYEISSYSQKGYRSRHNSKYWQYTPYLGFGSSAHSFTGKERYANTANIPTYIKHAGRQSVVDQRIEITEERAQEDYCILALRTSDGINYEKFQRRFTETIDAIFPDQLAQLFQKNLLEPTSTGCRLSKKGLDYGNYVFEQFLRDC